MEGLVKLAAEPEDPARGAAAFLEKIGADVEKLFPVPGRIYSYDFDPKDVFRVLEKRYARIVLAEVFLRKPSPPEVTEKFFRRIDGKEWIESFLSETEKSAELGTKRERAVARDIATTAYAVLAEKNEVSISI